jgi:hypothetical protein
MFGLKDTEKVKDVAPLARQSHASREFLGFSGGSVLMGGVY